MIVVVECWECAVCERKETTGGALPRGWRYATQGELVRPLCDLCKGKRQTTQEGALTRCYSHSGDSHG